MAIRSCQPDTPMKREFQLKLCQLCLFCGHVYRRELSPVSYTQRFLSKLVQSVLLQRARAASAASPILPASLNPGVHSANDAQQCSVLFSLVMSLEEFAENSFSIMLKPLRKGLETVSSNQKAGIYGREPSVTHFFCVLQDNSQSRGFKSSFLGTIWEK